MAFFTGASLFGNRNPWAQQGASAVSRQQPSVTGTAPLAGLDIAELARRLGVRVPNVVGRQSPQVLQQQGAQIRAANTPLASITHTRQATAPLSNRFTSLGISETKPGVFSASRGGLGYSSTSKYGLAALLKSQARKAADPVGWQRRRLQMAQQKLTEVLAKAAAKPNDRGGGRQKAVTKVQDLITEIEARIAAFGG